MSYYVQTQIVSYGKYGYLTWLKGSSLYKQRTFETMIQLAMSLLLPGHNNHYDAVFSLHHLMH